jgi:hypothetical protein
MLPPTPGIHQDTCALVTWNAFRICSSSITEMVGGAYGGFCGFCPSVGGFIGPLSFGSEFVTRVLRGRSVPRRDNQAEFE